MGSENSAPKAFVAEPYIVVGDGEMQEPQPAQSVIPVQQIVSKGFAATWSMVVPQCMTPLPRSSHFWVHVQDRDIAIAGYGIGSNDVLQNDVWKLDLKARIWSRIEVNGVKISPRNGTTAVLLGSAICLFGGFNGRDYLSEFHVIDTNTWTVSVPQLNGHGPSGRIGHVMAAHGNKILVWGGYNGDWLSDLWILDTETRTWRRIKTSVKGRTSATWANSGDDLYIYGAAKTDGLLRYSWTREVLEVVKTTGNGPSPEVSQAAMVAIDRYLLFFGGKLEQKKYSLMYGYDTLLQWWFVFHVLPDGNSTTISDGFIEKNGLFMVPRIWSASICYRAAQREVVLFLGAPFLEPPNLGLVHVGDAISILHQRMDMLDVIK